MSKKDPKIIRIGDEIRIIKPDFFIRCGYPLSLKDGEEIIKKEYKKEIYKFIYSFPFIEIVFSSNDKLFNKIVKALAFDYIKSKGFGGIERKIYTKELSSYKDELMIVDKIKFVKTGKYVAGSTYSYEYPEDYDAPELVNQKTHKLIHIHSNSYKILNEECTHWIEVVNVEKIMEK